MVRSAAGVRKPWLEQAGERIRVVDIFDEVEGDLRAERAERLLKKYAWLLIVLVAAIIGAAVGWQLWARHQASQDAAAAARYVAVQTALTNPTPPKPRRSPRSINSRRARPRATEPLPGCAPPG